jgi:hypothetical protein
LQRIKLGEVEGEYNPKNDGSEPASALEKIVDRNSSILGFNGEVLSVGKGRHAGNELVQDRPDLFRRRTAIDQEMKRLRERSHQEDGYDYGRRGSYPK